MRSDHRSDLRGIVMNAPEQRNRTWAAVTLPVHPDRTEGLSISVRPPIPASAAVTI
jgi:hypothetical protein